MEAKSTWQILQHSRSTSLTLGPSSVVYLKPASETESFNAELLICEIDLIIQRVAANQLSAGQGWREVKCIMQSRENNEGQL